MRVLLAASLLLTILMAGCHESGPFENAPDCPTSGLTHYEIAIGGRNATQASQAMREKGWSNITVRVEGVGGFPSSSHQTILSVDCPANYQDGMVDAFQNRTGGGDS